MERLGEQLFGYAETVEVGREVVLVCKKCRQREILPAR